jgi:hypothetical protein
MDGGCTNNLVNQLLQSPLPISPVYTVAGASTIAVAADVTCTLFTPGATTVNFVLTGAK